MERTIPTGCFVVCNFGPNGYTGGNAPVYLRDPTRGVAPHTFTANLCKAQLYAYESAAEADRANENELLKKEKHPLAGHLYIAEVQVRILPASGEEGAK